MRNAHMPGDAAPSLIVDAKMNRLMLRIEQTEALMERALRHSAPAQAARYGTLCEEACAACKRLLTSS